ncbi:MAG: helix-turn-helix transcriptional regulator [Nanoarchaeota archaeon]
MASLLIMNNLRAYRTRKKMTQEDLAKKASVSRQTIISIENGKYTPSLPLSLMLAEIFGCSVEDLFDIQRDRRRNTE